MCLMSFQLPFFHQTEQPQVWSGLLTGLTMERLYAATSGNRLVEKKTGEKKCMGRTRLESWGPRRTSLHSTPLNKKSPKRISCAGTAQGELNRLMDTRSACYCCWDSNTKSFSSTITPERGEREIRPGETMHFRKILGLGRVKIYLQLYSVCFQRSVSRTLVVLYTCNSNPLIVLQIQYVSRSLLVTC